MRRYILLLTLIIATQGCVHISRVLSDTEVAQQNKAHLAKLSIGMSKSDAVRVMGTQTRKVRTVYYDYGNQWEFPLYDLEIKNPYKAEVMKGKEDKSYEIVYYYTTVKKLDGAIADDELTPLVSENDRLLGWGGQFLERLIREEGLHQVSLSPGPTAQ